MHSYLPAPVSVQAFTAPASVRPAPGIIRQWSMTKQKHIHFIRRQLHNKLHSESGASLMVALLFFVMCATVGTVVLVAASGSAGRDVQQITDEERQRYSLQSAAQMIVRELSNENNGGTAEANGITCRQKWAYREIELDWVLKSANGSDLEIDGIDGKATKATKKSNLAEGEKHRTRGSYVLDVDQKDIFLESNDTSKHDSDPDDNDSGIENATDMKAVWNEKYWTRGNANVGTEADADYKRQMTITPSTSATSDSLSVTSFTQLRDVLAIGIYRNYWNKLCKINKTGGGKSDSFQAADNGLTGPMSDPWENGIPAGITDKDAWESFSSGSSYRLGTTDLFASKTESGGDSAAEGVNVAPFVINPPNDAKTDSITMYPVYADVTMDENFNLIFHLYCGSLPDDTDGGRGTLDSVKGRPDRAASDLWISIPSDTVKVSFTSDTQTTVKQLDPLIVVDDSETMEEDSGESFDVPRYDEPFYYFHKTNRSEDEVKNGAEPYQYSYYTVDDNFVRNKYIYDTNRSVTFRVSWDNGTISMAEPDLPN